MARAQTDDMQERVEAATKVVPGLRYSQVFRFRLAQVRDAAALATLAEQTFRDAFGVVNTPENMNLHCAMSFSPSIQAREISDPQMVSILADSQGQFVGFAQLRLHHGSAIVPSKRASEIRRMYVARDWHGKGLAHGLMKQVLKIAAQEGSDSVWLGVWEKNPRAMAFYRKFGFRAVGEHTFALGQDLQRDVIMVTDVKPTPGVG
jgi:GNAT superfamily N-acetyltransferase